MKPNGDWEPIDEVRAAWRPRVDLPHALFEILLKDHMNPMKQGFDGYDAEERASNDSARKLAESVRTLALWPDIMDRASLGDCIPADGHMAGDLRDALLIPYEAAANPARLAWAGLGFIHAVQDVLPKNYWCSRLAMEDATRLAVDNHDAPGAHYFVSTLCAYYHMQAVNAALPHLTKTLREGGHYNLALLAGHLYTKQKMTMAAIRDAADHSWRAQIPANGNIVPFRPGSPRP
jgi:hypothetical protein